MGKTIFEWTPNGPATKEIQTLTEEIIAHVQEDLRGGTEAETVRA